MGTAGQHRPRGRLVAQEAVTLQKAGLAAAQQRLPGPRLPACSLQGTAETPARTHPERQEPAGASRKRRPFQGWEDTGPPLRS